MPRLKRPRAVIPAVIDKAALAKEIAAIIDDAGMTQLEAAWAMRDAPSQVSLIVNGRLRGFATERLLRALVNLGSDIDIRISKAKGKTGKVRVVSQR